MEQITIIGTCAVSSHPLVAVRLLFTAFPCALIPRHSSSLDAPFVGRIPLQYHTQQTADMPIAIRACGMQHAILPNTTVVSVVMLSLRLDRILLQQRRKIEQAIKLGLDSIVLDVQFQEVYCIRRAALEDVQGSKCSRPVTTVPRQRTQPSLKSQ